MPLIKALRVECTPVLAEVSNHRKKPLSAATLSSSSFLTASFARSASSFALEERCSAADAADNVIAKVVEPVGLDLAIARLKWVERSRR